MDVIDETTVTNYHLSCWHFSLTLFASNARSIYQMKWTQHVECAPLQNTLLWRKKTHIHFEQIKSDFRCEIKFAWKTLLQAYLIKCCDCYACCTLNVFALIFPVCNWLTDCIILSTLVINSLLSFYRQSCIFNGENANCIHLLKSLAYKIYYSISFKCDFTLQQPN